MYGLFMDKNKIKEVGIEKKSGLMFLIGFICLMWVLEILDVIAGGRLDAYGIVSRQTDSFSGIVMAPLLHADFNHLLANTIPLLILGVFIALISLKRIILVTAFITIVGGFAVWLFGPANTVTIGASGVVFGYAAYLITRGIFTRNLVHIIIGCGVVAVFGASLAASLLPQTGVSWQGHLFGAIAGILAASIFDKRKAPADTV